MNHRLLFHLTILAVLRTGDGQEFTQDFDTILSAHTVAPYCPDYYKADENFVACCSSNGLLTSGIGPGHVTLPACCWTAATCTGAAPPMYDWTIVNDEVSIITEAPLASAPASIPAVTTPPPVITTPQQTTGPAVSTQLPVSAPSSPPASKVPLPELCSDPKWTPSPENWEDANVDTELANWWTSTTAARGSATFVDWISQSFGDRSRNQQCGIGLIASCSMPDCQAFQAADGPRWVYFVRVSLVEMNTMFNNLKTATQDAETDLTAVLSGMAADFFPWKDPKTNFGKVLPVVQAVVCGGLSLIPGMRIVEDLGDLAVKRITRIVDTTKEMTSAGFSIAASKLGNVIKTSAEGMRTGFESWAKTLFNGEADVTGKTILAYLNSGRFTFDYNIPSSWLTQVFFQIQVSKLVNQQWSKDNSKVSSHTFVMCANATDSPCSDDSQFSENGRVCCLYSMDKKGEYVPPPALSKLVDPPYNISTSDITASSLHSYLSGRFEYDESTLATKIEESISVDQASSFLAQGAKFEGIWTLPVCDVGIHSDWVADYGAKMKPCCCGAACNEDKLFLEAAGLKEKGYARKGCATQLPGFNSSTKVSTGEGALLGFMILVKSTQSAIAAAHYCLVE
ncbi:hypothetical protein IFR04_002547 [Cadophora malorum]|uniref:Uncharacterized protein n=1 Tax=Cadophora malorum TaxID=108018 RepID=A0A8H7WGH1_9HELO|nr:hypothetical protein IFR04_002547 [Cadophora malorum]